VGSSGIQTLFQMMEDLRVQRGFDVKVAGMNSDFQRLWSHRAPQSIEFHENLDKAVQSFQIPKTDII
jgi:hypothetical protein